MRRWPFALLIVGAALLLFSASRSSFGKAEAWWLWHSTLPSPPIDGLRARLDDEISRARALQAALSAPDAPYPAFSGPLLSVNGLWARAIGAHPLPLRLPSVYAALMLLALALALALLRGGVRRWRVLLLLLLGLPALAQVLLLPPRLALDGLPALVQQAAALRAPADPLLNAAAPWSPLALHAQQAGLLDGPRLELAWQSPPDAAALRRLSATTRLASGAVWVLADAESEAARLLDEALRADGRAPSFDSSAQGATVRAYTRP